MRGTLGSRRMQRTLAMMVIAAARAAVLPSGEERSKRRGATQHWQRSFEVFDPLLHFLTANLSSPYRTCRTEKIQKLTTVMVE
jgi:hypothetical protein